MGLWDGVALTVAIGVGGVARYLLFGLPLVPNWSWLLLLAWWVVAYQAQLLPSWGLGVVEELKRIVTHLALVFGGTAVVLFLSQQAPATSRFTLSVGFVASVFLVPMTRMLVKRVLIAGSNWGVPTAIYGGGEPAAEVIRALHEEAGLGYLPVGVFDPDPSNWGDSIEGVPIVGTAEHSTGKAAVAILAMPEAPRERIIELLDGPLAHYRQVVLIPDLHEMPTLWVESRNLAGILGLEITARLLDPLARISKRALDVFMVVATAPAWVPLFVVVSAAIWLEDRHSPFFLQERVGENGRLFRVRKFRTMVPDAEGVLQRELDADPVLREEWEENFKLREDPRITRVGRFLRRTSLDEIPQYVNVIRGEMSLVGPRPLPQYHFEELPERARSIRSRARPGMTGMWQISGRSDTGNEGLIRWDSFYVRNWSVWLDIVILVRTLRVVARGQGAY